MLYNRYVVKAPVPSSAVVSEEKRSPGSYEDATFDLYGKRF